MNHLDALDAATAELQRSLASIRDGQWTDPTPCTEWTVRDLVAHVVGGNRFSSLILSGATCHQAMDSIMTTPQLGPDPALDFANSARGQRRHFGSPDRLTEVVDHPVGTITAGRFLTFRVLDLTVHAWDLAAALGGDTKLDPDLVDTVLAIISTEGGDAGYGMHALGTVDPDAPALDHLLDLTGRTWPT